MEYKDYYAIMGVDRDASQDEIKRAYRKLARRYHPDVSSEADAEARFQELQEAYEVLKDPEKRQAYDQMGHDRFELHNRFGEAPLAAVQADLMERLLHWSLVTDPDQPWQEKVGA